MHRYNRRKSLQILTKLQTFDHHGQRINYLRKINPFVFEELLLDALQSQGYSVRRNSKYTGDNGIDGIAWKDGRKILVQAKRYKGHINLKHLKEFSSLVKRNACYGFFCHTGRTGKHSKEVERGDSNNHHN
ncbi:restriction endonuclease [Sphingobacterium lactis]|uniref:restriction endonuclease n=1 Tax=Sphingobacterium TaxID=28453 RepID=UPI0021A38EDF|nr:restriction endonuclease [Sphingobacterium hotanense]MCT1525811.1 restriction endonuclease [Sphingobacterium hotanense]